MTVKDLLFGDVEDFELNNLSVSDVSNEYIRTSIHTLVKSSNDEYDFLNKFSIYYDLFSAEILDSVN